MTEAQLDLDLDDDLTVAVIVYWQAQPRGSPKPRMGELWYGKHRAWVRKAAGIAEPAANTRPGVGLQSEPEVTNPLALMSVTEKRALMAKRREAKRAAR